MAAVRRVLLPAVAVACFATPAWAQSVPLFDGHSLSGWRLMAVHGGRGGVWQVADGVLVADQDSDHTGGLLGTTHRYGDYELVLEFTGNAPFDSGIFLRTRPDGMGYQITLDDREDGFVGSLYDPLHGFLQRFPDWRREYRRGEWNMLRVRISGQPPRIEAWLNGVQTVAFDDSLSRYPALGVIGLQVHGGRGAWGDSSRARFRNIRITELP